MKGYFQKNINNEKRGEQQYFLSLKMFKDGICTDLIAKDKNNNNELFIITEGDVQETRQKLIEWAQTVEIKSY